MTNVVEQNEQFILDHAIACSLHDYEVQVAASASSSHGAGASQVVIISCDVCDQLNPSSTCFLDMFGCDHILCLNCHAAATSGPSTLRGSSSASSDRVACPVPGCLSGFIPTPPPPSLPLDSPPSSSLFYCNICMETKPAAESFLHIQGCSHVFCRECVASYVAAKVEDNEPTIGCPHVGCDKGHLEPQSCRDDIAPQVFDRWGALLCETSIARAARFYCPYDDCSALLVNDDDDDVTASDCPHCGRAFCVQCRVPWHAGVNCQRYRALGKEKLEQRKFEEVADKNGWKRCPKCTSYVERTEGCVFIMCRCKHCFCFLCLAPMNPKDNRHYCTSCKLTWDSKPK